MKDIMSNTRVWFIIFSTFFHWTIGIGPGLLKIASSTITRDTWDSPAPPNAGEANSYAYWNCHTIPPNMTLCKSVGYSRMVLPNFLQHESLREAIQQANVWVTLVNTDCHPDIQRFLCSLYAPVCLKSHQEAKIPPCWELCDQVRNACLPRMRLFGFDWPDIVKCKQFPKLAESMCIPPQENTAVTCVPCEQAITLENIASSYCMADVVLKASLKDLIPQPTRGSIVLKLSSRTIALKLIRNDGTQLSSIDQYRQKRRSRQKRNHMDDTRPTNSRFQPVDVINPRADLKRSSFVRYPRTVFKFSGSYRQRDSVGTKLTKDRKPNQGHMKSGSDQRSKRRRKARDSRLHDLDGITELLLGCSACTALLPLTNGKLSESVNSKRWLVMGRRIKDEKSNRFTHQLQVTFLGLWDRDSVEFKHSLNTIRKETVSNLCSKNKASLSPPSQTNERPSDIPRPLKILRSAPHELSDSPNQDGIYEQQHLISQINGAKSEYRSDKRRKDRQFENPRISQSHQPIDSLPYSDVPTVSQTSPRYSDQPTEYGRNFQNPSTENQFGLISDRNYSNPSQESHVSRINHSNWIPTTNQFEFDSSTRFDGRLQDERRKARRERRKWKQMHRNLLKRTTEVPSNLWTPHPLPINPYSDSENE